LVAVSALLVVALDRLGAAGYRFGPAGVAVLLIGGVCAATYLAGPRSGRLAWSAAAAVLGAAATGLLVQRAPLSAGMLRSRMDKVEIPFATKLGERESGHSWCRPTCPVVSRAYRLPSTADGPAMIAVGSALAREGFELRPDVVAELQRTRFVRLRRSDLTVEARLRPRSDATAAPVVDLEYRSRRRG
jgi:hypothetical protein